VTLRNTEGLTLIEVLVAVVLFATAMLLGARSIVGFVHQVAVSEVRVQAAEFALEEMERVKLLPYQEIVPTAPAPVPEAPDYVRSVDVAIHGTEAADLYGYRVVTVTVQPPAELEPVSMSTAVAESG
jgi:prepilin-type N-terminal cleavage/methylation domain-containing protein